jgi:hypothetical protein
MILRARSSFLVQLMLAAGLGLVIERLVVTDSEAIESLVEDATKAIATRDFEKLREHLTEDFSYGHRDRDASLAYLEEAARRYAPRRIDVVASQIAPHGDRADCHAALRVYVYGRVFALDAMVHFAREDDGWRISGAELVSGP